MYASDISTKWCSRVKNVACSKVCSTKGLTSCSNGKCTRMPMLCTPWFACDTCAPSLAACIRPGPPPVMMSPHRARWLTYACLSSREPHPRQFCWPVEQQKCDSDDRCASSPQQQSERVARSRNPRLAAMRDDQDYLAGGLVDPCARRQTDATRTDSQTRGVYSAQTCNTIGASEPITATATTSSRPAGRRRHATRIQTRGGSA